MRLAPPLSPLGLLLSSEPDDLDSLSTEELRHIHACERQRLRLTETVGVGTGIVAALAAGRIVRR